MSAETATLLLDCRNIGVRFGGVAALSGVDFTLYPGEVHGLVGCNGAGKSTLMKVLAGVVPDYSGEILIDNRPIRIGSPREGLSHGIAWSIRNCLALNNFPLRKTCFWADNWSPPGGRSIGGK